MVRITPLELIGTDDRGYTCEYFHERMGRHLVIFRKAGTLSGNHYHKGASLSKQPEILILLSGTAIFRYGNIQERAVIRIELDVPSKIEIDPYVWHELETKTDCTLIELGSLSEHNADTYRL